MSSEDNDTSSQSSSDESASDDSVSDEPIIPSQVTQSREIEIEDNTTRLGGMMVNSAIGKRDLWEHVQKIKIRGNICEQFGTMINYRIDEDGLELASKDRERQIKLAKQETEQKMEIARRKRAEKIAERREQMLWEKQNGFI